MFIKDKILSCLIHSKNRCETLFGRHTEVLNAFRMNEQATLRVSVRGFHVDNQHYVMYYLH